ncbi:MAG TPA: hypothetical protein VGF95_09265 [Solirubrobacteraceae bacterium]|jgi:hypothetical protein
MHRAVFSLCHEHHDADKQDHRQAEQRERREPCKAASATLPRPRLIIAYRPLACIVFLCPSLSFPACPGIAIYEFGHSLVALELVVDISRTGTCRTHPIPPLSPPECAPEAGSKGVSMPCSRPPSAGG